MKKTDVNTSWNTFKDQIYKIEQTQNTLGYHKTPFMNDYQVCNKIDTTGAIYGAGTPYTSRTHEFIPGVYCCSCCTRSLVPV